MLTPLCLVTLKLLHTCVEKFNFFINGLFPKFIS